MRQGTLEIKKDAAELYSTAQVRVLSAGNVAGFFVGSRACVMTPTLVSSVRTDSVAMSLLGS